MSGPGRPVVRRKLFCCGYLHGVKQRVKLALGIKRVVEPAAVHRLQICYECPRRVQNTCSVCGCPVTDKVWLKDEKCPDDPSKWGRLT